MKIKTRFKIKNYDKAYLKTGKSSKKTSDWSFTTRKRDYLKKNDKCNYEVNIYDK